MREIKFRGKTVAGNWVYGYFYKEWDGRCFIKEIKDQHCRNYQVIPETVGQFINLPDKNGKEIYEGDILKLDSWTGTQQISFIEGAFCLADKNGEYLVDIHYIHHADTPQATVIGNIHENLELINY